MCANHERGPILPTELFIAIIEQVGSEQDLLLLSRVCRPFHELSLRAYFNRYDFDPQAKVISLNLPVAGGNHPLLLGLAIFLGVTGTSPKEIAYDCGHSGVPQLSIDELRLFTRYLMKLAAVERVTLRLSSPPWRETSDWSEATIDLLLTILSKGCRDIHITTTQLSSVHPHEHVLSTPAAAAASIGSNPSEWLKKRLSGLPDMVHHEKHLETCTIQTFPHFLRPFYFSTINANAQVLTHLSFKNIFGGDIDFGTLVTNLQLPQLKYFGLKYGVVQRESIVQFLSKHPDLDSLEYHHIRYPTSSSHKTAPPIEGSCGRLTSLTTSPEHILKFLPPASHMPLLNDITIRVENHMVRFKALEDALWHLSSCVGPISLTLHVTTLGLGFGVWFQDIFQNQSNLDIVNRPESHLHAVETLVLDNGEWGLTDDFIARVPAWAGLFPALKNLTLRSGALNRRRVRSEESPLSGTFSGLLKSKCRRLQKVSVLNTSEWNHSYIES